jgi:uncharacterized protein (TIGR03546 family)
VTLLLKQLFSFIRLLNSETGTNQIAAGLAAGFILGMAPSLSLQTLLVFVLIFAFRIQIGAVFVSMFFFKFAAFLLDPAFDSIGQWVLTRPGLESLFTAMYNMPLIPWTRFNNTVVMGAGVLSIALFPVVFFVAKYLVRRYRVTVIERFKQTRFWKAVQASSWYQWYYQYDNLYG